MPDVLNALVAFVAEHQRGGDLLQELIPGLTRLGLPINAADPFAKPFVDETQVAAKRIGVQVHLVDVRRPDDIDAAFAAMTKQRADAVIVQGVLTASAWQTGNLAVRHHLPSLSVTKQFAQSGGLMSYSGSFTDIYRRVINLKTAKALGLTVPSSLVAGADQVIE